MLDSPAGQVLAVEATVAQLDDDAALPGHDTTATAATGALEEPAPLSLLRFEA